MNSRRLLLPLVSAALIIAAFALGRRTAPPRSSVGGTIASPRSGRSETPATPATAATNARANPGATDVEPTPPGGGSPGAAQAILSRLTALSVTPKNPPSLRQLLVELERLKELGPAALPAIREFLAGGQDADLDAAKAGFRDGKVSPDFLVPPSLRLGLLEVLKNIGGRAAEELLVHELKTTGRGVEAAYLAAALQQIAPGRYQDVAVAAARDLLAMPLTTAAHNPLDRSDREYLYAVLAAAGDRSQVTQAQAQLFLPTGKVDLGALRYLQQTLGEGAVNIAAQAWQDPRVAANQREPLARLALAFVGTSNRAEQLYETAINDPQLSPEARKNLIEDLNQDGFANLKKLTPADVPLIQRRLAIIDQLAPRAKDPINAAAFAEARKDLVKMRETALRGPPPKK